MEQELFDLDLQIVAADPGERAVAERATANTCWETCSKWCEG